VRRHAASARAIAIALVVLTALTSAAPGVIAAETKPEAATETSAPLSAAALRAADEAPATALAQTADTSAASDTGPGFMGTGKGKFLAVLFLAGAGWAIYSAHHDREPVRSPVR
jgi:hypothetical protein